MHEYARANPGRPRHARVRLGLLGWTRLCPGMAGTIIEAPFLGGCRPPLSPHVSIKIRLKQLRQALVRERLEDLAIRKQPRR